MTALPAISGAAAICLLAAGACGPLYEDDFGPPAGHGRVEGKIGISLEEGLPDAEVLLTRCGPPVGGLAGEDVTAADGSYSITVTLPPEGVVPPGLVPPIVVSCDLIAGRGLVEAPVDVRFVHRRADVEPVIAHLVVGKGRVAACEWEERDKPAPVLEPSDPSTVVPGEYVVRFEDSVFEIARLARDLVEEAGGELLEVYVTAIEGFAARLDDEGLATVRASACVRYVAPNGTATTQS